MFPVTTDGGTLPDMFLHLVVALALTGLVIGACAGLIYGVGLLRHGRKGMEQRKTQHVLRSYGDDRANDPTGGWADF